MVATVVCQYIHIYIDYKCIYLSYTMILTWHNDACYNILVVQNAKKQVSRCFFHQTHPKIPGLPLWRFFFTSGVSILLPKVTDGHFTCDELKKSIFGCSCSGCKKCPEAVFFCWRYWLPVEGWSFITLQLVSFQASCRGEKTAFNSTIQTPKFFFFGTYIIKGFLELNPVWLVKCRYDEKAGWGYPDATNSSRIFKRKVYKKSFKVLPSCSMFDQQRPGVSTRFEVCVCVCCNWGVLLRLVFYVGGLRPSLSQKTKKSRE